MPRLCQIDAAALRPIEDGRLERLGAHDRAVDLLPRQPFEIFHDVLIRDLQRLDGRAAPCSIKAHSASEAAMAEVQPNVR